ncbi:MAG: hypothetical protein AAF915_07930 [Cyanobacteria bacterium P01_D01_bin.50]
MKISILQLNKLVAATFGFGIAFIITPQASIAQTSENLYIPPSYEQDNFDKQGDGGSLNGIESGSFDPMSLIHRANFGTLNWQEFSSQNAENINSEAGSFREKQRRLLQQRTNQSTNGQQQPSNFNFSLPVYTPAQTEPGN